MAHSFTTGIFLLMLVALVAKSVQVPLHTWIPEAMAAPTPVSAAAARCLLCDVGRVPGGAHAQLRSVAGFYFRGATLIWIGTITMAVGVMYAMVQTDLKRMLAFSTVSQIGYMMLGIGIGTPLAITAGLLHCLNHGFFKGGLFLTAGSVQHAAGTPRHEQARRAGGKDAADDAVVADRRGQHDGNSADERVRQQVDALRGGIAVGMGSPGNGGMGGEPAGTVFLGAKATSAVFLGPTTKATEDAHGVSSDDGLGHGAAGSRQRGFGRGAAVGGELLPESDFGRAGDGRGCSRDVAGHFGRCR